MSTGTGALEQLSNTLTMIFSTLKNIDEKLEGAGLESIGTQAKKESTTEDTPTKTTTRGKKTASKKTASKKTASKKKAPDVSDKTVFRKMLFNIADASGVSDVMPKVKAFIVDQGYASSEKIEVDDREDFMTALKDHLAELAEEGEGESEEDEIDL